MKKSFFFLATIGIVLCIGFIIVFSLLLFDDYKARKNKKNAPEAQLTDAEIQKILTDKRSKVSGQITEKELKAYKKQGLNPFGEKTEQKDLTYVHYNEYIHGMTHQKVHASKKWGYYEIHPKRIEWLLEGLEIVKLKDEELYREILTRWKNGDFSQIDEEHNIIWEMEGGVVGIATGIMTSEEEQKYIEGLE